MDGEVWFFFASRRRHTSFDCDWSSDVCSSDLATPGKTQRNRKKSRSNNRARRTGVVAFEATTPVFLSDRELLRPADPDRSEERRVGKECRSRWSRVH